MTTQAFTARTFGVEIEAFLPVGQTRRALAAAIRAAGVVAHEDGYHHVARGFWRVITDASLGYDRGVEVVSPILRGPQGLEAMKTVMRAMEAFGCTVSVKCGFHVHVGCADLKVADVRRVAKCFAKFETVFDLIVPPSRRRDANQYVQSNRRRAGGSYSDDGANRAMALLDGARTMQDVIYANQTSRYFKLNLMPLNTYGTIEFRHGAGTVDAEKAAAWVWLLSDFIEGAVSARPRSRTSGATLTASEELERFFTMFRIAKPTRDYFRARAKHFARLERNAARGVRRA